MATDGNRRALFVAALAHGATVLDASATAGISERTAHRWFRQPDVAAVEDARKATLGHARERLLGLVDAAADTLGDVMAGSVGDAARVAAARTVPARRCGSTSATSWRGASPSWSRPWSGSGPRRDTGGRRGESPGRLDRIARAVGHGPGPRVAGPRCEGSGRVHGSDTPWIGWRLSMTMAEVAARLAAELGDPAPERFSEPEPVEELEPCGLCRTAGTVAAVAAEQWRESAKEDGARHLDQLTAVADRLTACNKDDPGAAAVGTALASEPGYGEASTREVFGGPRHGWDTQPVLAPSRAEGHAELRSWRLCRERGDRPATAAIVAERLDQLADAP